MSVASIISGQQTYANSAISSADNFINRLLSLANLNQVTITGLPEPGYVNRDNTELSKNLLLALRPIAPALPDVTGDLPTYTQGVTIDELGEIPVPDFTGSAPTLEIPQSPDSTLPSSPSAPSIQEPVLPSAPTVDLPSSPNISDIAIPELPSIDVPAFDVIAPIDDLVAPTSEFQWYEEAYRTDLLDALKVKLLSDLQNGTYGLETADEDALWNRARDRELEATRLEIESAFKQGAARGFPLPPGDMNVALQRAQQNIIDKFSDVNRDIMIKRNDQYFQARQFTIEQARQLENTLIGFHSSIMERSLNAAKATLESGIAIFNATVAQYNARVEAYKTSASVFESRIRASLVEVERYRTQMEGKKLESDIQRQRVEVYRAQLEGINSVIGLYRTQLEAAQVQSQIEATRIQAFRALVDGYKSQVDAKVAEFGMYEAQIRGEVAKVDAYKSEADAYTAIVNGKKVKSDIMIARLEGQIRQASQEVETFRARIEGYRADLQGQSATLNARVSSYGADVSAYSAAAGALAEAYRLNSNAQALEDNNLNRNKEIALENARLTFEGLKLALNTNTDAAGHASTFYAALAAGAVNSINALSTLSE